MKLRVFSVLGEALNFGGRRMETIARVAWLPVVLMLLTNMVTMFAHVSVIAGRLVTFEDAVTFFNLKMAYARFAAQAFQNNPVEMWTITGANLAVNAILGSSFMAPLIRYSGLGEKPHPGLVRMPFGPDQLRFIISGAFSFIFIAALIVLPMGAVSFFVLKYIIAALSQTLAVFPDPNSLHTIEFVTVGEKMAAAGSAWMFQFAVPLAAAAPFALILWYVIFRHFHPRHRPSAPEGGNIILRGLVSLFIAAALSGGAFLLFRTAIANVVKTLHAAGGETIDFSGAPANAPLFIGVTFLLLVLYFNLRLVAYPGVAVCRKSMAFAGTFRVSRGWNILRLSAALTILIVFLWVISVFILNVVFLGIIMPSVFSYLYTATSVSTRLVNSGVTADWVDPLFNWVWNVVKILINIFWWFFFSGVIAGLFGRLYRDSEREETAEPEAPFSKAVWRRK